MGAFSTVVRRAYLRSVVPYRIRPMDRSRFKRCRRAWDFGAWARQNWEPVATEPAPAVIHALDVYYHPAMWDWPRPVVLPLVHQAVEGAPAAVHALIDAYAAWAAPRDDFTPIQVASGVEVNVPDPVLTERDLETEDGAPVRFVTRLDVVVVDAAGGPWAMTHRVGASALPDPAVLGVEEDALTDCWTWQHFYLDARMAGLIFNEVRTDVAPGPEAFRRTVVPVGQGEVERAARQLGYETLDMLDPGLVVYPSPAPEHCSPCPFLGPCRAVREGKDPAPLLSARYRHPDPAGAGDERLGGGGTWGLSPRPGGGRPPPPDRC